MNELVKRLEEIRLNYNAAKKEGELISQDFLKREAGALILENPTILAALQGDGGMVRVPTREFYIIWNDGRNEAFVTDDKADAVSICTGESHYDAALGFYAMSSAGEAFHRAYEDDDLNVETIRLPASQENEHVR